MKFIIHHYDSFPSPDSNGYPAAWVREWVGLSVGERWREE